MIRHFINMSKPAPHMDAEAFREQDDAKLEKIAVENMASGGLFYSCGACAGTGLRSDEGFDKTKIDRALHSTWRSDMLINWVMALLKHCICAARACRLKRLARSCK